MRTVKLLLASGVTAFVFAGAGVSQPPAEPPTLERVPGPLPPGRLGANDVVERVLSFDKNKDGQITADELPERMQHLVAQGDINKDGHLDADEVMKLASGRGRRDEGFQFRTGGPGPGGGGVFGRSVGPGPGTPGGPATAGPGRIGPGPIPGAGLDGLVEDLKLADKKKQADAKAAVKAHQENVRKLLDQAQVDLLKKMKGVLSEEEYKDFKAALERGGGGEVTLEFNIGPPPDAPTTRPNR